VNHKIAYVSIVVQAAKQKQRASKNYFPDAPPSASGEKTSRRRKIATSTKEK
jgi:hypothetical protein